MILISNLWPVLSFSYLLFLLTSFIAWKKGVIALSNNSGLINSLTGINMKNISGIILLGLPLIIYPSEWLHLLARPASGIPVQGMTGSLLIPVTCLISITTAFRKNRAGQLPEKDRSHPGLPAAAGYLFIRTSFLIVYECFFRGLLLFTCVDGCGIGFAIVINLILYTLLHAFGNRMEMLACFPFGIILCSITLWWQSILPAIILHLILALVHEIYLLHHRILSPKIIKP
ncbi:MAG TPA: CPBP family intramembrane glutamic endopeptidase [Puia sp.]|nr:CPBP family intramembrane glutamic endopeptidase [Puia sp.]